MEWWPTINTSSYRIEWWPTVNTSSYRIEWWPTINTSSYRIEWWLMINTSSYRIEWWPTVNTSSYRMEWWPTVNTGSYRMEWWPTINTTSYNLAFGGPSQGELVHDLLCFIKICRGVPSLYHPSHQSEAQSTLAFLKAVIYYLCPLFKFPTRLSCGNSSCPWIMILSRNKVTKNYLGNSLLPRPVRKHWIPGPFLNGSGKEATWEVAECFPHHRSCVF